MEIQDGFPIDRAGICRFPSEGLRRHRHVPTAVPALVDNTGSVAEVCGGAARHTRAWSVGVPAVVAGCRRLSFVPLPCQMQRSATVNKSF